MRLFTFIFICAILPTNLAAPPVQLSSDAGSDSHERFNSSITDARTGQKQSSDESQRQSRAEKNEIISHLMGLLGKLPRSSPEQMKLLRRDDGENTHFRKLSLNPIKRLRDGYYSFLNGIVSFVPYEKVDSAKGSDFNSSDQPVKAQNEHSVTEEHALKTGGMSDEWNKKIREDSPSSESQVHQNENQEQQARSTYIDDAKKEDKSDLLEMADDFRSSLSENSDFQSSLKCTEVKEDLGLERISPVELNKETLPDGGTAGISLQGAENQRNDAVDTKDTKSDEDDKNLRFPLKGARKDFEPVGQSPITLQRQPVIDLNPNRKSPLKLSGIGLPVLKPSSSLPESLTFRPTAAWNVNDITLNSEKDKFPRVKLDNGTVLIPMKLSEGLVLYSYSDSSSDIRTSQMEQQQKNTIPMKQMDSLFPGFEKAVRNNFTQVIVQNIFLNIAEIKKETQGEEHRPSTRAHTHEEMVATQPPVLEEDQSPLSSFNLPGVGGDYDYLYDDDGFELKQTLKLHHATSHTGQLTINQQKQGNPSTDFHHPHNHHIDHHVQYSLLALADQLTSKPDASASRKPLMGSAPPLTDALITEPIQQSGTSTHEPFLASTNTVFPFLNLLNSAEVTYQTSTDYQKKADTTQAERKTTDSSQPANNEAASDLEKATKTTSAESADTSGPIIPSTVAEAVALQSTSQSIITSPDMITTTSIPPTSTLSASTLSTESSPRPVPSTTADTSTTGEISAIATVDVSPANDQEDLPSSKLVTKSTISAQEENPPTAQSPNTSGSQPTDATFETGSTEPQDKGIIFFQSSPSSTETTTSPTTQRSSSAVARLTTQSSRHTTKSTLLPAVIITKARSTTAVPTETTVAQKSKASTNPMTVTAQMTTEKMKQATSVPPKIGQASGSKQQMLMKFMSPNMLKYMQYTANRTNQSLPATVPPAVTFPKTGMNSQQNVQLSATSHQTKHTAMLYYGTSHLPLASQIENQHDFKVQPSHTVSSATTANGDAVHEVGPVVKQPESDRISLHQTKPAMNQLEPNGTPLNSTSEAVMTNSFFHNSVTSSKFAYAATGVEDRSGESTNKEVTITSPVQKPSPAPTSEETKDVVELQIDTILSKIATQLTQAPALDSKPLAVTDSLMSTAISQTSEASKVDIFTSISTEKAIPTLESFVTDQSSSITTRVPVITTKSPETPTVSLNSVTSAQVDPTINHLLHTEAKAAGNFMTPLPTVMSNFANLPMNIPTKTKTPTQTTPPPVTTPNPVTVTTATMAPQINQKSQTNRQPEAMSSTPTKTSLTTSTEVTTSLPFATSHKPLHSHSSSQVIKAPANNKWTIMGARRPITDKPAIKQQVTLPWYMTMHTTKKTIKTVSQTTTTKAEEQTNPISGSYEQMAENRQQTELDVTDYAKTASMTTTTRFLTTPSITSTTTATPGTTPSTTSSTKFPLVTRLQLWEEVPTPGLKVTKKQYSLPVTGTYDTAPTSLSYDFSIFTRPTTDVGTIQRVTTSTDALARRPTLAPALPVNAVKASPALPVNPVKASPDHQWPVFFVTDNPKDKPTPVSSQEENSLQDLPLTLDNLHMTEQTITKDELSYVKGDALFSWQDSENDEEPIESFPTENRFSCNQMTKEHKVSFLSPKYPEPDDQKGICTLRVFIAKKSVCQLRVDFHDARMLLPRQGFCLDQYLHISGAASSNGIERYCGRNPDQHFYVDLDDPPMNGLPRHVDFTVVTAHSGYLYRYGMLIRQVECSRNNKLRAPIGCTQYFPQSSGVIKSFNFDGGQYFNNQSYRICIKGSGNACAISFEATHGSFGIQKLNSKRVPANRAGVGDKVCNRDYLWLPDGVPDLQPGTPSQDRYCGAIFSPFHGDNSSRPVLSIIKNKIIPLEFRAGLPTKYNTNHHGPGFKLAYSQLSVCNTADATNKRSRAFSDQAAHKTVDIPDVYSLSSDSVQQITSERVSHHNDYYDEYGDVFSRSREQ